MARRFHGNLSPLPAIIRPEARRTTRAGRRRALASSDKIRLDLDYFWVGNLLGDSSSARQQKSAGGKRQHA
jgi:hypothetical protein